MTEDKNIINEVATEKSEPMVVVPEHEDTVSEQRTSKLGYILLILMSIALFVAANRIITDLARVPYVPVVPSSCIKNLMQNVQDQTNINLECPPAWDFRTNRMGEFSDLDKKYGLDLLWGRVEPQLSQIVELNMAILQERKKLQGVQGNLANVKIDYGLSLQEGANNGGLFNQQLVKKKINYLRGSEAGTSIKVQKIMAKRADLIKGLTGDRLKITSQYKLAMADFKAQYLIYRWQVFALDLLFILPLFLLGMYLYFSLKRKNSEYTVILTAVNAALGLILLQLTFSMLSWLLPLELIYRYFSLFLTMPLLRYLIYYGSILVIILLFGGLVFYIQKTIYNPQRVALKRLKNHSCPRCSSSIHHDDNFCQNCSLLIQVKCGHCGVKRVKYASYCQNCGQK